MAHQSALIAENIHAYLQEQQQKSLLRFITCGSVDDGKSTLIGRLLWDSKLIFEDQLASLGNDSKKIGTQGDDIDYALLLDGLQAEREQGITIDVAYRFFSTDKRKFIVADTPGHEQYTRNMVTGASTAQVAIILIDARKGALPQTNRHSYLAALVGIKKVVVAINKMDLVDYSEQRFNEIVTSYKALSSKLGFQQIDSIPLSALRGDNVIFPSSRMTWYKGTTLLDYLEAVDVVDDSTEKSFRLAVQWVNRPDQDFRGYCGTITSGMIKIGDPVVVSASGQSSRVVKILVADTLHNEASAGQAVTLCLEDEIDISRGDLLSSPDTRPVYADQFKVNLVWMNEEPLLSGRSYLLKMGTLTVTAQVTEIKYRVNVNTMEHLATKTLELNDIGVCNISTDSPVAFDAYSDNRPTGSFILIDRLTNATVGAGMIEFALRRSGNIHWQTVDIDKQSRAALKGQQPKVLWFTGLSGSGKSTIANLVEKKLHALGKHTYLLDGDNIRHGLNRDLGFTDADRVENIRRIAETTRLFVDAGIIVLTAFISPFESERQMARSLFKEEEFFEVYVDTPLEICEKRDSKGLYKKARSGELKNFTGIDSIYEVPENPEIVASAGGETAENIAESIVAFLLSESQSSCQ